VDYDEAFLADEIRRLSNMSISLPKRPDYSHELVEDPPAVAELTSSDIDAAVAELAAERGETIEQTWEQVYALTGGERDRESVVGGIVALSQMDGETLELSDVSAAERRELAAKGWALADGSYAIKDKAHLHAAAVLAASGHGDVQAARRLIRRRARDLGVNVTTLPGFGTDDHADEADKGRKVHAANTLNEAGLSPQTLALAAEEYAEQVELAASNDWDSAEGVMSRNPEYFSGVRKGKTHVTTDDDDRPYRVGRAHPRSGKVTTRTRAHEEPQRDSTDRDQPGKAGIQHREVQRYLRQVKGMMRASAPEKPYGNSDSYPPREGGR